MADDTNLEKSKVESEIKGTEHPQGHLTHADIGKKYEASSINLRPIFISMAVIIAMVVVSQVVLYGVFWLWDARQQSIWQEQPISPVVDEARPEPPVSGLQTDESFDLANVARENTDALDGYTWVDQQAGVARIPVDEAMRILAEKGQLPAGESWSLRPGEQMVGGVIMTPEQVQYANQPPSAAPAERVEAGPPAPPATGAQQTPAPAAAPATPNQ